MKKRLDILLVEQGLATGRDKAKALIMSGQVYVNGQKCDKAGEEYKDTDKIEVRGDTLKYVSRGGLKLEKAMSVFPISLKDKTCCDFGASTGGFTDCMLQNGAKKVYAFDVGYGQLAWSLRQDQRVVNYERTNIRYLTGEEVHHGVPEGVIHNAVQLAGFFADLGHGDQVIGKETGFLETGGQAAGFHHGDGKGVEALFKTGALVVFAKRLHTVVYRQTGTEHQSHLFAQNGKLLVAQTQFTAHMRFLLTDDGSMITKDQ